MDGSLIGAIEAGGTKFVCALADPSGAVIERARIATRDPAETFGEVTGFFRAAAARHGPIAAFGVGSFGPIDINPASPNYGRFTTTPKPGWSGASWCDALAGFGVPIRVDSDVAAAALAEAAQAPGCRTLAYTTIGTGIGTGIVRDGASLMGFSHFEAGHIHPARRADDRDFGGSCPYHGDCLEGLASGPAIIVRWGSSLDQLGYQPDVTERVAQYIAHLAAALVMLHMPDRLIFGGGVMHAPGLLEELRAQTEALLGGYIVHPRLDPGLESFISLPVLGDEAGLTGAILLAQQALQTPR